MSHVPKSPSQLNTLVEISAVSRALDLNSIDPLPIDSALPALVQAQKIGDRTAILKFDWENIAQVLAKVDEEIGELKEAILEQDVSHIEHELGDLLFATTQLARHLGLKAEQALNVANHRFKSRFMVLCELVKEKNLEWDQLTLEDKEELWQLGKKLIASK